MRKLLLILSFLFFSTLSASTYNGVNFSDYEEKASLYLCNYYPRSTFIDLGISSSDSSRIIDNRTSLYSSMSDISNLYGISSSDLEKIKSHSHLIEWNIYTDDFGMTIHQTNFLYGLTGALIGFIFLFGFIQIIISEEYK